MLFHRTAYLFTWVVYVCKRNVFELSVGWNSLYHLRVIMLYCTVNALFWANVMMLSKLCRPICYILCASVRIYILLLCIWLLNAKLCWTSARGSSLAYLSPFKHWFYSGTGLFNKFSGMIFVQHWINFKLVKGFS